MSDLHSKLLAAMLTSDGEIRPPLEAIEDIVQPELDAKDAEIARLQRSAKSWEETALTYAQNVDYWRERAERAEAAIERVRAALAEMGDWDDPSGIAQQVIYAVSRALAQPADGATAEGAQFKGPGQ